MSTRLFIEGVADEKFLKDIIFRFFNARLSKEDIVDLKGYTNIYRVDNFFKSNTDVGGTNLLFIDTDYKHTNGGFERRRREIITKREELGITFELFLFPNNKEEGDLEVLLERIINPVNQDIFKCWQSYEDCLSSQGKNYTVPARKTKIYGYMEALHGLTKNEKDKAKEQNRNYLEANHWNLESEELRPLIEFLRPHF